MVDSPSVEILKSDLGRVLGSRFQMAVLDQEVGPDDLWRSLQTSTILLSYEL